MAQALGPPQDSAEECATELVEEFISIADGQVGGGGGGGGGACVEGGR